jgi:uncharacterized protein YcbX
MRNLKLSEIWIYPIKSLGGIRLSSSKVMEKGLQYDRRFMLVDEGGMFMTQRVSPQMALFKTSIFNEALTVTKESETVSIPLTPASHGESRPVQIWHDLVLANEVSPEHSSWFSDLLNVKCKLVFFPEENPRLVDPEYNVRPDNVSFADAYPLLIIGQASLDDLNARLSEPLPMNRFRPNLVFTGGEPYEEDNWRNFKVGSNKFVGVKPCARCAVPTVNQDTGAKGKEPTRTLATYRSRDNKVFFGQNLVAVDHDKISVGDSIELQLLNNLLLDDVL